MEVHPENTRPYWEVAKSCCRHRGYSGYLCQKPYPNKADFNSTEHLASALNSSIIPLHILRISDTAEGSLPHQQVIADLHPYKISLPEMYFFRSKPHH